MKLLKFLKFIIIIILILISCESPTETDTTPPTVDIIDPLDKSTVNEIVEINCTSSDNIQVQKLVLWVDNTITTEVDETEPYSFYWNTVDYDNNSYHTIFVRSFDKSGNKTDSESFIYKVDNSQSHPYPVNVNIDYSTEEMTVSWSQSTDGDFDYYKLYYSESEDGIKSILTTYNEKYETIYTITEFNPLIENWFWVNVVDTLGLSTMTSNKNEIDSPPTQIDITSVDYDLENMTVSWDISIEDDFISYELLQSTSENGEYESVVVIDDISTTSYSITNFDPTIDNWFKIKVTDFWGLTSIGTEVSNEIDNNPNTVDVTSVTYDFENMTINWNEYEPNLSRIKKMNNESQQTTSTSDNDFVSYELLQSTSEYGEYESVVVIDDISTTFYSITDFDPTIENWFKIRVTDFWGLTSIGHVMTNIIDSTPTKINISSIEYNLQEMVITWDESVDNDFISYKLLYSEDQFGGRIEITSIDDISITNYTLSDFDPTDVWYWIQVTDYWGQTTESDGYLVDDSPPTQINISSIVYDLEEMVITWEESTDNDFVSYELLQSTTEDGEYESVTVINDISTISYQITDFDPTIENWFKVKVTDFWELTTLGSGLTNEIDSPPTQIELNYIVYENNSFIISWTQNNDDDFISYTLMESFSEDMSNPSIIFTTNNINEMSFTQTEINENEYRYYQIICKDSWGLETGSEIKEGNSWLKFVNIYDYNTYGNVIFDETIQQTSDGGYIIIGSTTILKMNSLGNTEWVSDDGGGTSIQQTIDGGYILSQSNFTLLKINSNGIEEWYRIHDPGVETDKCYSVVQTTDGGYIMTGYVRSFGSPYERDLWVIKTDSNGYTCDYIDNGTLEVGNCYENQNKWVKLINKGGDDYYEDGRSIQQTDDGGYIIVGYEYLIKIDSHGNEEWTNYGVVGHSVKQTNDGGFIVVGGITNYWDGILIKLSNLGVIEWSNGMNHEGKSVQQTTDGGYVVTGRGIVLVKTDSVGNEEWSKDDINPWYEGLSVEQCNDGGYIINGSTNYNPEKIIVIKTDSHGNTVPESEWE